MKRFLFSIAAALAVAIVIYSTIKSEFLLSVSNSFSDLVYQTERSPDSRIVIVGIEEESLEQYGNFPWERDVIATAIETLNKDPNNRPLVIGVDILFTDQSENDGMFLNVASKYDNIVLSSYAEFETELITLDNGDFYLDDYFVSEFYPPFSELNLVTKSGHVNAMLDSDGVLRHAMWEIELSNGETVPSFNQVIAEHYLSVTGEGTLKKPPTDSKQRWYVVQQSAPGSYYDGISVADIINEKIDSSYFADKIVLIGPYARGLQDDYHTPISSTEKMYGVEYQANAISALLTEDFVKEVPFDIDIIITIILVLLLWRFFYKRKFIPSLLVWFACCSLWIGLSILLFNVGFIISLIYFPLFATIAFVASVGFNYALVLLEKNKVAKTFERYLAPEIVKKLLSGDKESVQLGGKVADIAVLFADIRGFTPLSEKLPPQKVVEIVNSYLEIFSDCIFKNEGTVDKYIGDCIMAFWGAPLEQQDSSYKAVLAAVEIVKRSEFISRKYQEEIGQELKVGVGISFGAAVVGNIGSGKRMDYTIIGDTVNSASRLESVVPGGMVYVDKNTMENVGTRFNFEKIDNITLKGKSKDYEIFKVVEHKV